MIYNDYRIPRLPSRIRKMSKRRQKKAIKAATAWVKKKVNEHMLKLMTGHTVTFFSFDIPVVR